MKLLIKTVFNINVPNTNTTFVFGSNFEKQTSKSNNISNLGLNVKKQKKCKLEKAVDTIELIRIISEKEAEETLEEILRLKYS